MEILRWLILLLCLVAVVLMFLNNFNIRKDILLLFVLILPVFGNKDLFESGLGIVPIVIQIFFIVIYIGIFLVWNNRIAKLVLAIILLLQSLVNIIKLLDFRNSNSLRNFSPSPRIEFSYYDFLITVVIIVALSYAIFSYSKRPVLKPMPKFHCSSCGTEIEPDSKFCTTCGKQVVM